MPKINKVNYQFADIELALSDKSGEGLAVSDAFTELNYSDNVEREKLRGAARVAIDATEGEYDAEGSVTFHQKLYRYVNDWCKEKGIGFYDAEFDLTVNYRNKGEAVNTDVITNVKFGSRDFSNSSGPSPLTVPCDLFINGVIYSDGIGPFGETL